MKDSSDIGNPKRPNVAENAKKKRKSPAKLTPKKSHSNLTPRKKVSKNRTPRKNGSVATSSDLAWKIDLWLEAKLSAEEDSKMFAGRKIHPFFSLWKVEKKNQEQERGLSAAKRENGGIACGPIHVFENVQGDASPLDWRSGLTFLEETTIVDFGPENSNSFVLEGSVESLNFDNLPSASRSSSASISQNIMSCPDQLSIQPEDMMGISPANSAVLANEQAKCPSKSEDAKVELDLEVNEANNFSGHTGIFRKSDTEPVNKFLQESMRSYYNSCEGKAKGCLWIHKYKPTKALEMCGNEMAVNFLGDWLRLWHKRRTQCRKDSSNRDRSNKQDGDSYICSNSHYASEDINEEDSLQNVLLITGPVGSGKSAAVYACAQEQGFEVLELNASECRNGAAVKRYYGEAFESHRIKRLFDHTVSPHKKTVKLLPTPALPNSIAAEKMGDGVIELITTSDDEAHSHGGTPPRSHGKSNVFTCDTVHTLILVEDVDILFPEDRGCIAAIQHISETAKGPIILTSNSNNAGLPNNFARQHVSFSLPLPDELLCHMYMVCVTEEVNINPLLLKKFIQSCNGDIRKTIMQLQFWFQSKKYIKDRKVQKVYGSLPFDLEACHQIIPKILPWNSPSDLSKLIEKEVAKSITIMEENSSLQGLVKELDINERKNDLDVQCMKTDNLEAKVGRKRRSLTDGGEFESQHNGISELSNCSGSPVTSPWQKGQSKFVVMSSDSVEKYPNNGHCLDMETTTVCNVIDECSHVDFKLKSNCVESMPSSMVMDMVQNLWRKLRVCQKDLGQHTNPEQLGVIQVVKHTSGLTNLISEADLLFRNHQQKQCGIMEPPMSLSDEATYSWYDEQMMMSSVAVHGFCFYAKHISDVGSKFGNKNEIDLTSEMLDCTTNVMALGKLSRQDQTNSMNSNAKKQLEVNNPTNDTKRTSLSNVVQSIIPTRSSLAMKGLAFSEYISSLRQISISEGFRISHDSGKMRKQRRGAKHYLSRGTMLSPEDISLLGGGDLYRKISSEYTANMESNCT